jgi:hypothetical protein
MDESAWPPGFAGEHTDPWADTRLLHLVDPKRALTFTFTTSSAGGRWEIASLKGAISNMRAAGHGNAVPIVRLSSESMKTKFGLKKKPHFDIVGWV